MRCLIPLLLAAATVAPVVATPAAAQTMGGYTFSTDIGLGVKYGPSYMGSDEQENSPWIILRNTTLTRPGESAEDKDGFSFGPSFDYVGRRDSGDGERLQGMDKVKAAGELGLKLGYGQGPARGYVAVRKGFGGHHGVVGEFGASYQVEAGERLTLVGKAEAQYGNRDFTDTYFGVDQNEVRPDRRAYTPGGGLYGVSVGLEARYSLTENTSLLGEVQYTRLLGDAADSPIVDSKGQPVLKLGIVRHFDFRF